MKLPNCRHWRLPAATMAAISRLQTILTWTCLKKPAPSGNYGRALRVAQYLHIDVLVNSDTFVRCQYHLLVRNYTSAMLFHLDVHKWKKIITQEGKNGRRSAFRLC